MHQVLFLQVMEVDGKKPDIDLPKSSDRELPPHCQPCSNEGKRITAHGYCQTCEEYLCEQCFKVHTIPSPLKYHVLLDKSQMPQRKVDSNAKTKQSICTIRCTKHQEEFVKFLCQSHDVVVCGVCAVLNHQKPCTLEYIPDLTYVQTFTGSTEYKDLLKRLETLEKDVEVCKADVQEKETSIEGKINAAAADIEEFRTEINKYLDRRQQTLLTTAKQMKQDDLSLRKSLVSGLETLHTEIQKAQNKLTSLQNDTSNLFVTSKQIAQQYSEFEKQMKEFASQNTTPYYSFKRDDDLQRILSSNGTVGMLERSTEAHKLPLSFNLPKYSTMDFRKAKVTKLPEINMKTFGDKTDPFITGLTLLHPNTLITIDYWNSALKTVDTTSNVVKSQLTFTGNPWDITLLPVDQAAVTIPEEKEIQIISTKGGFSCLRVISVSGNCYGICSTNHNIVISFRYPAMIKVMDFAWKIIHTLSTDDRGMILLKYPNYITVSMEETGEVIHVSDFGKNTITQLSMKADVISTYKHNKWNMLAGLIYVGQRQLLVSNYRGKTVDVVSEEGKNIVTLLDSTHGIRLPWALCYCASQETLYVSSYVAGNPVSLLVYKCSQK